VRWVKRGLLFDPARHSLPAGCTEFAQAPQALVRDDCVRIYFSTRARDAVGQYVSHIAYVDFDRTLSCVLRTSTHPVLPRGALGCFDQHGIFPINVVAHGNEIRAYTCGWSRRVSVPVETAIGLARSLDGGETFERLGPGPVMGPTPMEPCLVGDPFVMVREGRWHMWYIFGTGWTAEPTEPSPARVYKIAHAFSDDGIAWQRDGLAIVADVLGAGECQALPTVMERDGAFHMFFCFRHATDFRDNASRGYRIGHAWSKDMRCWTRNDQAGGIALSPEGWDSQMMCYPHVFRCDDEIYMLYNGNAFGRGGFGVAVLER
jgi:predicted GH43/DUF377 family glycosyl hydrolase